MTSHGDAVVVVTLVRSRETAAYVVYRSGDESCPVPFDVHVRKGTFEPMPAVLRLPLLPGEDPAVEAFQREAAGLEAEIRRKRKRP